MQYGGKSTAVCMIKIDSQLSCTGIVGGRGYGSRLRMPRDFTKDDGSDLWISRKVCTVVVGD